MTETPRTSSPLNQLAREMIQHRRSCKQCGAVPRKERCATGRILFARGQAIIDRAIKEQE